MQKWKRKAPSSASIRHFQTTRADLREIFLIRSIMCMHTFFYFFLNSRPIIGLYFILRPLMLKTFCLWDNIFAHFPRSSCHFSDYVSAIIIICFQSCVMITLLCCSLQLKAKMEIWYICCTWCSELYFQMTKLGTNYCTDACHALHALFITER